MSESKVLLDLVQKSLDDFCDERQSEFSQISSDLTVIPSYTKSLLAGGKRFRALFCYWSWVAALDVASTRQTQEQRTASTEAMVGICSALEMFHAAALVHDDLLDQSDTRRGEPAVHKRFEALHTSQGFAGSPERFGLAGSVLVGDMMLGWSSEIFGQALLKSPSSEIESHCREEFSKMRIEVMAGQYLDVLEENAAPIRSVDEAVGRIPAEEVLEAPARRRREARAARAGDVAAVGAHRGVVAVGVGAGGAAGAVCDEGGGREV